MSPLSRLLFTAAVVLSVAPRGFADEDVVNWRSADVVRSQSPVLHTGGAECGCDACATSQGGWRSKMSWLIDVCCLKKRWFRNLFPYQSCYKPVPPYLIENSGYNASSWRRLPDDGRPDVPVIEGFPDELQPLSPPAPEAIDDAAAPSEEADPAPFAPTPKAPPLPFPADN